MKKRYLFYFLIPLLIGNVVEAASCSLEKQVQINNAAGAVTADAAPYEYQYVANNTETGEEETVTAYTGMLYVYNLTEDIYAEVSFDHDKKTVYHTDAFDDVVTVPTGGMAIVKNYTVSIYPTDKSCGKNVIRQIQVTVPRQNYYYNEQMCKDYPDYFYCSQFMTVDNISYSDFAKGVSDYAAKVKKEEEESRRQGITEIASNFVKKNWFILLILVVLLLGGSGTYFYMKKKKRKEQIV